MTANVLILGAAGRIGQALASAFADAGWTVRAQARKPLPSALAADLAALRQGRTDFSGVSFTERIDINQYTADFSLQSTSLLDLSECDLGPDFCLGDLALEELWLEHASSAGSLCLTRLTAGNVHAKRLSADRLTVIHGQIDGFDLIHSKFFSCLLLKQTRVNTLILDQCQSPQTIIDEHDDFIRHCSTTDAVLGRRIPSELRELF